MAIAASANNPVMCNRMLDLLQISSHASRLQQATIQPVGRGMRRQPSKSLHSAALTIR
jgi:hypothetical protein